MLFSRTPLPWLSQVRPPSTTHDAMQSFHHHSPYVTAHSKRSSASCFMSNTYCFAHCQYRASGTVPKKLLQMCSDGRVIDQACAALQ